MRLRVGSDVGGTFTDLWVLADDGRQAALKTPTTRDIVSGLLTAIELAAAHFSLGVEQFCAAVERFGHGTTAGLNALLTGRAAPAALVLTEGFADTIEIGRLKRQHAGLSDLETRDYANRGRIAPVVARRLVFEVRERVDRDGEVLVALHDDEAERVAGLVAASGVGAVAVSTLWSVANPVHELVLGARLKARCPSLFVSLSHEVAPVVGEYARASTTAVDAALGPVTGAYLTRLEAALAERGLKVPLLVMTSEGGVTPSAQAARRPVAVLLSGPAGGVAAAQRIGLQLGRERVLAVDVGGTSFDVGTIVDGVPLMRTDLVLAGADIAGPAVDVATIGAGGGSIARLRGRGLAVGPESAGADPGPACYLRGGDEPTATDADLVLGTLAERQLADGSIVLDLAAARRVIATRVAEPLGIDVVEAAWGIRTVLDAKMADLLRAVSVERGQDPREFVLLAGGGMGPSHAWALCRELEMTSFVVTPNATVQSAFGIGTAPLKQTLLRPHYLRIPRDRPPGGEQLASLSTAAAELAGEAAGLFGPPATAGFSEPPAGAGAKAVVVSVSVSVRYRGQAHHLDVPAVELLASRAALDKTLERFEGEYEALFGPGSAFREAGFELTGLRATATLELAEPPAVRPEDDLVPIGSRAVVFGDPERAVECVVLSTGLPRPGQRLEGPALVEYPGQTLVLPPGWSATTDAFGNVLAELSQP